MEMFGGTSVNYQDLFGLRISCIPNGRSQDGLIGRSVINRGSHFLANQAKIKPRLSRNLKWSGVGFRADKNTMLWMSP